MQLMKRLLARPPRITLQTSFAEAYGSGRFTQLELISDAELIREAGKHDLAVRRETLEELDRYGALHADCVCRSRVAWRLLWPALELRGP
jgi:hypothetical protein